MLGPQRQPVDHPKYLLGIRITGGMLEDIAYGLLQDVQCFTIGMLPRSSIVGPAQEEVEGLLYLFD